jgi:hypothetical protein
MSLKAALMGGIGLSRWKEKVALNKKKTVKDSELGRRLFREMLWLVEQVCLFGKVLVITNDHLY